MIDSTEKIFSRVTILTLSDALFRTKSQGNKILNNILKKLKYCNDEKWIILVRGTFEPLFPFSERSFFPCFQASVKLGLDFNLMLTPWWAATGGMGVKSRETGSAAPALPLWVASGGVVTGSSLTSGKATPAPASNFSCFFPPGLANFIFSPSGVKGASCSVITGNFSGEGMRGFLAGGSPPPIFFESFLFFSGNGTAAVTTGAILESFVGFSSTGRCDCGSWASLVVTSLPSTSEMHFSRRGHALSDLFLRTNKANPTEMYERKSVSLNTPCTYHDFMMLNFRWINQPPLATMLHQLELRIDRRTNRSINQSINQSIHQSIDQSIHQIYRSINQSLGEEVSIQI